MRVDRPEPRLDDIVWLYGSEKRKVQGFSEDRGTQLDDGRWVCASEFRYAGIALTGETIWHWKAAVKEPEVEPADESSPDQKLRTALSEAIADAVEGPFNTLLARVEEAAWGAVKEAEPVIERLCRRVVELEADVAEHRRLLTLENKRANDAIDREMATEEHAEELEATLASEKRRADLHARAENTAHRLLSEAHVENNKLRAELSEANDKPSQFYVDLAADNVELADKVAKLERELSFTNDLRKCDKARIVGLEEHIRMLHREGEASPNRDARLREQLTTERDAANEKLAQIEEALEKTAYYDETVTEIAQIVWS